MTTLSRACKKIALVSALGAVMLSIPVAYAAPQQNSHPQPPTHRTYRIPFRAQNNDADTSTPPNQSSSSSTSASSSDNGRIIRRRVGTTSSSTLVTSTTTATSTLASSTIAASSTATTSTTTAPFPETISPKNILPQNQIQPYTIGHDVITGNVSSALYSLKNTFSRFTTFILIGLASAAGLVGIIFASGKLQSFHSNEVNDIYDNQIGFRKNRIVTKSQ